MLNVIMHQTQYQVGKNIHYHYNIYTLSLTLAYPCVCEYIIFVYAHVHDCIRHLHVYVCVANSANRPIGTQPLCTAVPTSTDQNFHFPVTCYVHFDT